MKVLLVAPPSAFHAGLPSPSLGLATLAASLAANDIECGCLDCNFLSSFNPFGLTQEGRAFEERLLDECLQLTEDARPELVGISAWGVALPFAIFFSRILKARLPEVPIVVGGVFDADLAETLMRLAPQIEAAVVGEGEEAVVELAQRLTNGGDLQGVGGVLRRENGRLVREPARPPMPPDRWARPEYGSFLTPLGETYMIEGSRSCPYRCVFCSVNGMPFRRKDPRLFAREILDTQARLGPELVFIADNYVPLSGRWTDALCRALIEAPIAVRWTCCARADGMSPATTRRMVRAGCERIFLGVESVSWDTLTYIHKSKSVARYLADLPANIDCLTDQGLGLRISTILGFPTEGAGEMERTIEFVVRMREEGLDAYTGPLVAYPGSRLWELHRRGEVELRKISSERIRRNCAGLFADGFEDHPGLVPNNFMPKHEFLTDDEVERTILDGLELISQTTVNTRNP